MINSNRTGGRDHGSSRSASIKESLVRLSIEVNYNIRPFNLLYRLFSFLEFFQMLHFVVETRDGKAFDSSVFSYIQKFADILQLDSTIRSSGQTFHLWIFFASFTLNIAVCGLILICLWIGAKKDSKIGTVADAFIKFLGFYSLAFNSILIVPLVQLTLLQVFCSQRSEYFTGKL